MPLPTVYTEAEFAEFLSRQLGRVGSLLGWSVARGHFDEIVNDSLVGYGVSTIDQAINIAKLRALGRVVVWKAVVSELAADFDVSDNGQSYSRSQLQRQAQVALEQAQSEAAPYGLTNWTVQTSDLLYVHDPYIELPSEERTWPTDG